MTTPNSEGPFSLYRILIGISVACFFVGILFKIMHWPGAGMLITLGYLGIAISYPRKMLLKEKRTRLDLFKGFCVLVWAGLHLIYLYLLYDDQGGINARNNYSYLNKIASVFIIIWGFIWVYETYGFKKDRPILMILNILLIIGGVTTAIGLLLRMMHWPGARIALIAGIAILAGQFLVGLFVEKEGDDVEEEVVEEEEEVY